MSLAVEIDFDIRRIEGYVESQAESFRKEVISAVFNEVERTTPYKTGHAQRGWEKNFEHGEIWNDVPYILRLDQGSSKQAPSGMTRNALLLLSSGILLKNYRAEVAEAFK